jgi:hypothetical protein
MRAMRVRAGGGLLGRSKGLMGKIGGGRAARKQAEEDEAAMAAAVRPPPPARPPPASGRLLRSTADCRWSRAAWIIIRRAGWLAGWLAVF